MVLSGGGEEAKAKIDEIRTEIENLHYEKLPCVSLEHDLKWPLPTWTSTLDEQLKTFVEDVLAPKRTLPSIGNPNRGSHQLDPHPSVRPTYQIVQRQNVALPGSRDQGSASFRRTTCGGDE